MSRNRLFSLRCPLNFLLSAVAATLSPSAPPFIHYSPFRSSDLSSMEIFTCIFVLSTKSQISIIKLNYSADLKKRGCSNVFAFFSFLLLWNPYKCNWRMKLVTFVSLKWSANTLVSSYFLFIIYTPVKSEVHFMIYSYLESSDNLKLLLQVFPITFGWICWSY